VAHGLQMQALCLAGAGTCASNSALKFICVHQQGGWGSPVARAVSMALALGLPHTGQSVGSIAAGEALRRALVPGTWSAPGSALRMSLPATKALFQAAALAFWRQACSSGSV
jgi:hypothetical protein